jgi:methylase of polypeptide subunit release factors
MPTCPPESPPSATEPAERITTFGPLKVAWDQRVLEPRLWTLAQSEWVAELAAGAEPGPLLEVCAGAGHIGLAAALVADRDIVQIEADPVAAGYARRNAEAAGWGDRTDVRCAPMDEALADDERFPLLLADPPYLRRADIGRHPDDPTTAIDGGPDGLDLVRSCLAVAAGHSRPGAPTVLQVAGPDQADAVATLVDRWFARSLVVEERLVVDDRRALVLLVCVAA